MGASFVAIAVSVASPASAQEEVSVQDEPVTVETAEEDEGEGIVVVGSRIEGVDSTLRGEVFTAQDIQERGSGSLEDFLRTIPQNLSEINQFTNQTVANPFGLTRAPDLGSNFNALGISAANLGGVGSDATLVLVNGRRRAGAAGVEAGFLNLNSIPLNSVERIEVIYDGASSLYGSEALGGVINIVLKKDFVGFQADGNYEIGENGGDSWRTSLYGGYAWGSGSISATFSYREADAVNLRDAGFTTTNYEGLTVTGLDGQPFQLGSNFDFRDCRADGAFPAVLCTNPSFFPVSSPGLIVSVPSGFTGVPTIGDFTGVESTAPGARDVLSDDIPEFLGAFTEEFAGNIELRQDIGDSIEARLSAGYGRRDNFIDAGRRPVTVTLAQGQAYNPFTAADLTAAGFDFGFFAPPGAINATFNPGPLYDDGTVSRDVVENVQEDFSIGGGLSWNVGDSHQISLDVDYSRTTTTGSSTALLNLADIASDGTCSLGFLGATVNALNQDEIQAVADAQCAALTSSDPSVAFNPFDPSVGASASIFNVPLEAGESSTSVLQATLFANGELFELPGGQLRYAIGGEYIEDKIDSPAIRASTEIAPNTESWSAFGELAVPVFGGDFTIPGFHSLLFTGRMRYDSNSAQGSLGVDAAGDPIIGSITYSATSPSASFLWQPFEENFTIRGTWGRSFRRPIPTDLFNLNNVEVIPFGAFIIGDPFIDPPEFFYSADLQFQANPNLEPTIGNQYSLTARWAPDDGLLRGLDLAVNWQSTVRKNDQFPSTLLSSILPPEEFFALEELFIRDPVTNRVTRRIDQTVNLARTEFESIEYSVGYRAETDIGRFDFFLSYLNNTKQSLQATDTSQVFNRLGTATTNPDYRLTGRVTYTGDRFSVTVNGYHDPSFIFDRFAFYFNGEILDPTQAFIHGSYTTFDLSAGYQIKEGIRATIASRNVFNARSDITPNESQPPWDGRLFDPRGRTVQFGISAEF